jgi:hypothetical protein
MFRAKTATGERRQHTIERHSDNSNELFINIYIYISAVAQHCQLKMCDKCNVNFSPGFSEVQSAREAGFDPRIMVIWQRSLDKSFNYGGKNIAQQFDDTANKCRVSNYTCIVINTLPLRL